MDASTSGQEFFALLGALITNPAIVELHDALDALDALAEAPTDDPRIVLLIADLTVTVPDELFAVIPKDAAVVTGFKEAPAR